MTGDDLLPRHAHSESSKRLTMVAIAWTSDEAGMSETGTCGEEALHGDVRHAGPNNTTGGQPGAARTGPSC